MEFKKYKSLTNHYKIKWDKLPKYDTWVATEKIHGSNIQFKVLDGKVVSIGSRNQVIATVENKNITWLSDSFPRFDEVIEKNDIINYLENFSNTSQTFGENNSFTNFIVYGELFGQGMQNMEYDANKNKEKDIAFFTFHDLDDDVYIPVYEGSFLKGVKIIGIGKLDDLLDIDVENNKSLYGDCNAEGVVFAPYEAFIPVREEQAVPMIKYVASAFRENKSIKKVKKQVDLTGEQAEVLSMVTIRRIEHIISHGDILLEDTSDFPNIINAIREDIEKEFDYDKFPEAEKETLCKFKNFGGEVVSVARQYLQDKFSQQ